MCRASFVKEREKNVKKLTMKIILNDQKYHELLQNSKIYILNPNHKVKSSMTFFILIGKGPNSL